MLSASYAHVKCDFCDSRPAIRKVILHSHLTLIPGTTPSYWSKLRNATSKDIRFGIARQQIADLLRTPYWRRNLVELTLELEVVLKNYRGKEEVKVEVDASDFEGSMLRTATQAREAIKSLRLGQNMTNVLLGLGLKI